MKTHLCILLILLLLGLASALELSPAASPPLYYSPDYDYIPPPPPGPPPVYTPFYDYEGDDYYDYTPGPPPPPPAPCNPQDEATLLKIKRALNNSVVMSSWVPGTDCCNRWEFVGCDEATGRVIGLSFYGNGWGHDDLPRVLPPAVGDLTYLTQLTFYNNATGPIPRSLGKLHNLSYLYLSHNQFSGPIPTFFSRMPNLGWLELSGNKLTGRLPSSLPNATSLYMVKFDNNRLTGKIPSSYGRFKKTNGAVFNINLSNNRLTGPIPRSFGEINFRSLFLNGNRLSGDASFVFGKEKEVWLVDLSSNRLSFNMSNIEIPPQLAWLGLSQNQIYGGLPPALVNVGLSYFNVSYNRLRGPIPQGGASRTLIRLPTSITKACAAPHYLPASQSDHNARYV